MNGVAGTLRVSVCACGCVCVSVYVCECVCEDAPGRGPTWTRGGLSSCASLETPDVQRWHLQQAPGQWWVAATARLYPCIAPAVVGSYRRLEGKLVQEPFLQQRGGRGKGGEGCVAPQSPGASVSPRSLLCMRRHTAAFSASKCPAVTGKPSSGGGGSLRGTRRLCGSRETWHFRGLALSLSHVGEPCLQVPFGPLPCVHPGVPALLLGRHRSGGGRRRTVLARFP